MRAPVQAEGLHIGAFHGSSTTSSSNRKPPDEVQSPGGALLTSAIDAEVRRALDLAKSMRFSEAEQCLAIICEGHPERSNLREVVAAREAVAMCRQFHANASSV